MADDSPLSTAANIIGIITFVLAIAAAVYARWLWLKSRIALPYESIAEECQRVGDYIWETGMLYEEVDFIPSSSLSRLIRDVYENQILAVHEMYKLQQSTALERLERGNSARFAEIYCRLEYGMTTMRNMYSKEQIRAGFERLRKQVLMQNEYLDLQRTPESDHGDSIAVEIKKDWRRLWEQSLSCVQARFSASELAEARGMHLSSFESLEVAVWDVIRKNQHTAILGSQRFFYSV